MGKNIRVTSMDEMERAAKKLQKTAQNYKDISTKLMQQAKTMGAAWDGADNLAFVEQITGFMKELQAMSGRLAQAGRILSAQRANYANRQEANMTAVRRLVN